MKHYSPGQGTTAYCPAVVGVVMLILGVLLGPAPPTAAAFAPPLALSSHSSSAAADSATAATASQDDDCWQADLWKISQPLIPTPLAEACQVLERDGVVRLADCHVDPDLCDEMRNYILEDINKKNDGVADDDKLYVPGTRLRFEQPMDLRFGGDVRHDLLLPLDNCLPLRPLLESAVMSRLERSLLHPASHSLLPHLHRDREEEQTTISTNTSLELVEVASLIVRCGSGHQPLHGDFRRFPASKKNVISKEELENQEQQQQQQQQEPLDHTRARRGKLPPRLVTFVVLQDIPTNEHGATGFVTGTHTGEAHQLAYGGDTGAGDTGVVVDNGRDSTDGGGNRRHLRRQSLLDLSTSGVRTTRGFQKGDMLVYDASVLHWGGANSVEKNDRAILYFGVARPGAAQILSEGHPPLKGFTLVPPVLLEDFLVGR